MNFVTEVENAPKIETRVDAKPATPAEKVDVKGATEAMLMQAEVSAAAGDVLGSIESSESAEDGEGFGEGEQTGKGKQGHAKKDDSAAVVAGAAPLPPPPAMQKKIAAAIRKEIRKDERKILLAYLGLKPMKPDRLSDLVAKIRSLKDLLASLIDATVETLKGLYLKWVDNP